MNALVSIHEHISCTGGMSDNLLCDCGGQRQPEAVRAQLDIIIMMMARAIIMIMLA
jgi:hypothetical protein